MINVEFTNEINDIVTENLYQWDNYQTLKISGINFGSVTPKVHFANKKSKEALVVTGSLQSDGSFEVSIPNSLLTEKYDILAYVYTNTGLTNKTIKSITIPIIARLKPSEYYQPSDEDIAQIEAIELEAKAIIDGLTASEYDENETYKRPNIVYYNQCAYMCNSSVEITGITPTDTSKWQLIVQGELITGVSVNEEGKLAFTTSKGSIHTVDFSTIDTVAVDDKDIPALNLTQEDVKKVKTSDVVKLEDLTNTSQTQDGKTYWALAYGLYAITVKYNDRYYNVVALIDKTGMYDEDDLVLLRVYNGVVSHEVIYGDPFKTESSTSLIQGLYASDTNIQIVKVVKIMGV